MKHELLVPVGNMPSLICAINAGADAVYLGGKKFGARAYAQNFTLEEIDTATKMCHLYGVKIYITVNTLVYEDELEEAFNYVKELHQIGVDALIMQDIGLIDLVHKRLPNLEIHASTQMHNHSKESIEFLKSLGIKRIVFARELPLNYINSIDTELEKEVFIHGSLCISYSGQCYFSKRVLNRSGNRGECAGMCRLTYSLYENSNLIKEPAYLLSPKDLCSIPYFKSLMASNIKCFKIEGRMKSSEYVYMVTKIYRNLIDQYENNQELKVNEEDYYYLQAIFNRDYTEGYLHNDYDIINMDAPNHQGIKVGDVIAFNNKKIKIKLCHDLRQFESIRFQNNTGLTINFMYDNKDNLINKGHKGEYIYLDNIINLKELGEVMLTKPLLDIPNTIIKKIPINIKCIAKCQQQLEIIVTDDENTVNILSDNVLEVASKVKMSLERVKESLSKIGNTSFIINNIDIDMDPDVFIPMSILNNLRRLVLDKLKNTRENKCPKFILKDYKEANIKQDITHNLNILVRNKEQIRACIDANIQNIIVKDEKLYEKGFIYKVPRDNINHEYSFDKLLLTDYASMLKYRGMTDYFLNITNHYSLNIISKYTNCTMLSIECNLDNLKDIMNHSNNKNVEVFIYGNIELMLLKYCPLNKLVNKDKVCQVCSNNNHYYLKDRNNCYYKLENNSTTHSTTILDTNKIDLIDNIKELNDMGITNYRIELLDEDYNEVMELIERVRKIWKS